MFTIQNALIIISLYIIYRLTKTDPRPYKQEYMRLSYTTALKTHGIKYCNYFNKNDTLQLLKWVKPSTWFIGIDGRRKRINKGDYLSLVGNSIDLRRKTSLGNYKACK